jgi:site-specific DNA-cytosine methylase
MAILLRGLAELGYWWTYRICDSQYFNVPQRRARVFIVGHHGAPCPPEILFEPESVFRDPAARRQAREAIAAGTLSRALSRVGGGDDPGANKGAPIVTEGSRINSGPDGISGAVSAKWLKGTGGPAGDEAYNLVVDDRQVGALNAQDDRYPENRDAEQGKLIVIPFDSTQITNDLNYSNPQPGDPCHPLAESAHAPKVVGINVYPEEGQGADLIAKETEQAMTLTPTGSERKTDRGTFVFESRFARNDRGAPSQIVPPLKAQSGQSGRGDGAPLVFKPSHFTRGKDGAPSDQTPPLSADADKGDQDLLLNAAGFVRRLTPRECSRLQGFPDDWLEVNDADAEEARSREILHILWRSVHPGAQSEWEAGIASALLTPEVLFAGVYGGWVSWSVASRCAEATRALQGEDAWPEGLLRTLRAYRETRPSPYRPEPFEQLAIELGRPMPFLSPEGTQSQTDLLASCVRSTPQGTRVLRQALSTLEEMGRPASSGKPLADGPKFRMLGNAVTVPVVEWIARRLLEFGDV